MSDFENRYYQMHLGGFDFHTFGSGKWLQVGFALIVGSCLALLSFGAMFVRTSPQLNTNWVESNRPLGFGDSREGLALLQMLQSPWKMQNMNGQGKLYRQGASSFTLNRLHEPRQARIRARGKMEDTPGGRKSWDISRFVRQTQFFGYLQPPSPLKLIARAMGPSIGQTIGLNSVIYSAAMNPLGLVWGPLDDVIMGGSSQSSFDASTGVWNGTVVVANGGFAGMRTRILEPPLDLTSCSGLRLKVKGQGQRFKFKIRDDEKFDGISWSYSFDTNSLLDTEVKMKFSDFVATRRDQVVRPMPTLNVATITVLQLTYSKFQYDGELNPQFKAGEFRLVIKEIDTF